METLDYIYNTLVEELDIRLRDKGYTLLINQPATSEDESKYAIWWNKELHVSFRFAWFDDLKRYDLSISYENGTPTLLDFEWTEVCYLKEQDSELPIETIIIEFFKALDFNLSKIQNTNNHKKNIDGFKNIFRVALVCCVLYVIWEGCQERNFKRYVAPQFVINPNNDTIIQETDSINH